jgi:EmrB/QacA subfamily drug resistance transporter
MTAKPLKKWWILAAVTSCISMIFLDITVLPVALPTIERTLSISEIGLQWLLNAYTLALTIFVLAGGKLADMFGHRRIFCLGVLMFAITSAFCGLSTGEKWFIFSRFLQGVGGALLIPSTAAIIIDSFPVQQRGQALGIYVGIGSLFLATGPFIGGLLSQYLSWRLVFWINLPIAFIGYTLAMIFIPRSPKKREPFDFGGFVLFSLAITLIVFPLMQMRKWGWSSPLTVVPLLLGALLLLLFVRIDRKVSHPYVDFSLFRNRLFLGCLSAAFCAQFLVMSTVFWSLFFQNGLGFTPSEAGLLNFLANSPLILVAPIGGWLLDRYGPRLPMILGFSLVVVAIVWLLQVFDEKHFGILLSALIPFGCGIPLIFTPSLTAAMAEVESNKRGLVSGTMMTIRQLGATLGLAIFGSLFARKTETGFAIALQENPATKDLDPTSFSGLLAKVPSALEALKGLSASAQEFIVEKSLQSYSSAFVGINSLTIAMATLGLCGSVWLIRGRRRSRDGEKRA